MHFIKMINYKKKKYTHIQLLNKCTKQNNKGRNRVADCGWELIKAMKIQKPVSQIQID